ncbi:hypothetical protein HPB50_009902 [Hyalomma asiaticum]|uniref:Uncharacterized protein n=1 Tax=Hyalomma asiaticum TaxID=266040 RepID=A0ACB7RI30_HYAAI|nr:hypothetical protein HPB50_009902 [Hyalomma asiaticum]
MARYFADATPNSIVAYFLFGNCPRSRKTRATVEKAPQNQSPGTANGFGLNVIYSQESRGGLCVGCAVGSIRGRRRELAHSRIGNRIAFGVPPPGILCPFKGIPEVVPQALSPAVLAMLTPVRRCIAFRSGRGDEIAAGEASQPLCVFASLRAAWSFGRLLG